MTEPDGADGPPEVATAVAALDDLTDLPVQQHAAVFEVVHDRLRAALSAPVEG